MSSNHTPAPWAWFVREDGVVYLGTPDRGRLIVMDFVRDGNKRSAAVRFADWEGKRDGKPRARLGGLLEVSCNPATHPDARLIQAAPEMYRLLRYLSDHSNAKALLSEGYLEDLKAVIEAIDR